MLLPSSTSGVAVPTDITAPVQIVGPSVPSTYPSNLSFTVALVMQNCSRAAWCGATPGPRLCTRQLQLRRESDTLFFFRETPSQISGVQIGGRPSNLPMPVYHSSCPCSEVCRGESLKLPGPCSAGWLKISELGLRLKTSSEDQALNQSSSRFWKGCLYPWGFYILNWIINILMS